MPFKDHLLRVLRIDEDTWLHFKMLPVSFTTLVVPTASEQTLFHLRMYICNFYFHLINEKQWCLQIVFIHRFYSRVYCS